MSENQQKFEYIYEDFSNIILPQAPITDPYNLWRKSTIQVKNRLNNTEDKILSDSDFDQGDEKSQNHVYDLETGNHEQKLESDKDGGNGQEFM